MKFSSLHSLFTSITFRIGATLLIIIMIAELIAGVIWYQTNAKKEVENLQKTIESLMSNAADTYNYFHALPVNYRYLVMNQIRQIGGTRFFYLDQPAPTSGNAPEK